MLIIKNEYIAPFDVDDSLVMHMRVDAIPEGDRVDVYDALTGKFIPMRINRPMVRLLQDCKQRGAYVRVWSRGGWQWASDVVKALSLTYFVDSVESKPTQYYDDTPVEKWMVDRIYLSPDQNYKQVTNVTKEK